MYYLKAFDISNSLSADFKDFARTLYSGEPCFVDKNENISSKYIEKCFLVFKDDKIFARAAAIINPHISYDNKKTGIIGFFESVDNYKASAFLFDSLIDYFKKRDFEYILGPMNASTWHKYRITEPYSDDDFFLDNYNKPWYLNHFKDYGFAQIAKYISTKYVKANINPDRIKKFEAIFNNKGINIREIDTNNFDKDLEAIYHNCVESFKSNFLYSPLGLEEFISMYKEIKNFITPGYSLIAEDKTKKVYGFIFSPDNVLAKDKKSLIIKTVSILPEPICRGLGTLLVEKVHQSAFNNGYNEIIHALMHENNISCNVLNSRYKVIRRYSLFGIKL